MTATCPRFAVLLLLGAALPARAGIPYHDFDPATAGVQGPSHPTVSSPTVRLDRQHQLVLRMCATAAELAPIAAPHTALGSALCGGAPLVVVVFILNERRASGGTVTGLASRLVALFAGAHAVTGRTELLVTENLPVTEVEVEEKGGARFYKVVARDVTGNDIRLDLGVTAAAPAFQDDPIVLAGTTTPAPFRNLVTGVSFFLARSGYKAVFPASTANVSLSFGQAGKLSFSTGALSPGPIVGNIDALMPTLYLVDPE